MKMHILLTAFRKEWQHSTFSFSDLQIYKLSNTLFTCNRITMLVQYPSTISKADKCKHKFTFSSDSQLLPEWKARQKLRNSAEANFLQKRRTGQLFAKTCAGQIFAKRRSGQLFAKIALATWNCLDLADSFNALFLLLAGSLEGPIVIAKRCN